MVGEMFPQKSERHRVGLLPLSKSSFRLRRALYGVAQHRIADTAKISRRRASLIERGLIHPTPEESRRLQAALEALIAEAGRSATP
jgi:transcriptional regulator with XRE-family HTH domain